MLTLPELYPMVLGWLQAMEAPGGRTAVGALAHLVAALLTGQSLRPSALMRALWSPCPVPARQRYKRVARAWERPWLTPAWLTPLLVRVASTLVPLERAGATAGLTHVALDSVRCGPWEVFTLGVVWHGRVLPVCWRVLAYPWPKGQVTPAVCTLVEQVARYWPADRPVHLVADRAFPSRPLLQTLRRVGWGWTIRLRANTGVRAAGEDLQVRDLIGRARLGGWTAWVGGYGRGATSLAATLVVGRGVVVLPRHQRTVGTQRHRAARQRERLRKCAYEYQVRQTDPWVALCTSHATWRAAVTSYRRRWATEGTYRDAQSGWDGQHGWDLEPVLARLPGHAQAERLVGLWALGTLLQTWIGSQVAHGPDPVRAIAAQWTTTGRLSTWAHGQFALAEPSGFLHDWLIATFQEGARRIEQTAHAHPPSRPACRAA